MSNVMPSVTFGLLKESKLLMLSAKEPINHPNYWSERPLS